MPNPKAQTVTFEIKKAIEDVKKGKIEYRLDKYGIIHIHIGKVSFDEKKLIENYYALIDEINRVKPASTKGRYFRSITLTTTMGPGIKLDPTIVED